jgi:hypothetical protein
MLAESFLCYESDSTRSSDRRTSIVANPTNPDCTRTELTRLLALKDNPLRLDSITLQVARWFAAKEGLTVFPSEDGDSSTTQHDATRLAVFQAILNSPAAPEAPPACEERGYIGRMMCASRFASLVHHLRTNERTYDAIKQALNTCDRQRVPSSQCFVDTSFVRLLDTPERFMEDLVEDLLLRAWKIERHEEQMRLANIDAYPSFPKTDAPVFHDSHTTIVALIQFVNRRFSESMGAGLQWDPSSVPDRHLHGVWEVFHFLPYSIAVGAGVAVDRTEGGVQRVSGLHQAPLTLGWRPTLSIGNRHPDVALTLPFELSYFYTDSLAYAHLQLGIAAGVGAEFLRSDLFPIGFSLLLANHLNKLQNPRWSRRGDYPYINSGTTIVPEVSMDMLNRSLRAAVRWAAPEPGRREFAVQVSLADVNGLLYWVFRGVRLPPPQ